MTRYLTGRFVEYAAVLLVALTLNFAPPRAARRAAEAVRQPGGSGQAHRGRTPEALPYTLLLVGSSSAVTAVIGVTLGVAGALRRRRGKGAGLLGAAVVADSLPQFWLGMLLIVLFGVRLQWLPTFGVTDPEGGGLLKHLILPVATLTVTGLGYLFLYTRSSCWRSASWQPDRSWWRPSSPTQGSDG